MATDYSKFNQSQYDNQSKYLDNLINNGTAGQKAWAEAEKNSLNSQYKPQASTPSVPTGVGSGNVSSGSGSKNTGSSGTNYSGYNESQYNNQSTYLQGLIDNGSAGNKAWAQSELDKLNSQYQGNKVTNTGSVNNVNKPTTTQPAQTQPANGYYFDYGDGTGKQYNNTDVGKWDTSGKDWTTVGGSGGVKYAISENGTVIATDSNGVQTRFLTTNDDYNNFYQDMMKDIQSVGNSYTPTYTWTDVNGNDITTKNYLLGNADLRYALEQWMKQNNTNKYDIEGYAKTLYGSVGTQRADGSIITLADVDKELDRLGLSDYNSQNVTHAAGGNLIPKNEFVTSKTGSFGGSNSEDSTWVSYGGQDYLVGGDSANFIDYVNGKTGNTTNLDYIFDDMANNPYAKDDAEFAQQYQDALNQFNSSAGIQTPTIQAPTAGSTGTGGGYTGYDKVDQFIDYVNGLEGFDQATGGTSSNGIWDEIQAMLQGGLDSQKAFLDSQRTQAEQNAENLMRQAYVNQKLQGDSVKEAMSAAGLGTTGAMQSAMLGVQSNYNNNIAGIRSNLNQMISSLSEQELQALIDYTNNATKYAYQIQNDQQDQAYRNAQLYMQQLEMQQAQEQQKWENAYRQQLMELENQQYKDQWDLEQKQYEDALKQQAFENELAWNELLLAQQKASGKNNGSGINPVSPTANPAQGTVADQMAAQYGEALPPTVIAYMSQAIAKGQKPDMNVLNAYLGIN